MGCEALVTPAVGRNRSQTNLDEDKDASDRVTETNLLPFLLAASNVTNRYLEGTKTGTQYLCTYFGVQAESTFVKIKTIQEWHGYQLEARVQIGNRRAEEQIRQ